MRGVKGSTGFVSPSDRFVALVDMRASDECWRFGRNKSYGRFRAAPGVSVEAHRFAYELWVGPIPTGLHLDHLCRHPWCVNPGHLEAVRPRVNSLRGTSPCADNARQEVCKRGHPFTPENTRTWKGMRHCRACAALRARESRAAKGVKPRLARRRELTA